MTQVKTLLTDQQRKFAELLVYNEGKMSPAEAAFEAGYKTRLEKLHLRCVTQSISLWLLNILAN